ncbi:hypothetical protein ACJIZ3_013576 [Penstemon smallii]|uniref:AP2/ERF domain-containing protein n=1 Tax=Penstemon smallii TaxID=265156 RepID=A0ABD3RHE7_9LAMI
MKSMKDDNNNMKSNNIKNTSSNSICYGVDFHSVMPLKSHSHGMVPIRVEDCSNMLLSLDTTTATLYNHHHHNHDDYYFGLNYKDFFQTTTTTTNELQEQNSTTNKQQPQIPVNEDELVIPCFTNGSDLQSSTTKKRGFEEIAPTKQSVHSKSIDTFGQRTSQYRGVTRHRWTGRYEAHLWDNSCKKEGQTRKGRQGGYDMEEKAARAYDLAALKYWGPSTHINFPLENYSQELEEMKNMTRQEHVAQLRRKSSGFSRGASIYRGVTRHHQHGRWQARIGRVAGNKDLYLGTFSTQEEAGEAYDIAAIKFRGANAVTNFDISRYDVEKIMASNTLPTGHVACRRNKETEPHAKLPVATVQRREEVASLESSHGHGGVKTMNLGNYQIALQNLFGIDSTQTMVEEE